MELWYDTDETTIVVPVTFSSGLEINRPPTSFANAGLRYFATDTLNDWLCDGTQWKTNTPTPWTQLPLTNSWVNYDGGHPCQYRKIGDVVEMRGVVKNGTLAASIGTLPVGFRPYQTDETLVVFSAGVAVGISITSAGTMTVWSPATNPYVYLDGVRFSTVA